MLLAGLKDQMTTLSRLDWRLFLCLLAIGLVGTWVPLFDLDEGAFLEVKTTAFSRLSTHIRAFKPLKEEGISHGYA